MSGSVRVRFAPSPTGPLHVGGLRTALFNYLFAKQNKGVFVLRIEDTDSKRKVKGAELYLHKSLEWCGLSPDESVLAGGEFGPYKQSERSEHYKKHIDLLLKKGCAYYAFDSEETINRHREEHKKKGKTFIYNWHNRLKLKNSLSLPKEETEKLLRGGEPFVVRFKSPEDKQIITRDVIRGKMVTESKTLDDKVLYKSDGTPTYHLANVVDDYLMEISHVIRGEEWLPSLPLHFMLYDAFGWKKPVFAHISLILNPGGKGKLSKRSGEKAGAIVYPLAWTTFVPKSSGEAQIRLQEHCPSPLTAEGTEEAKGYKEAGILPEGLVNYMALLGWSSGSEKEVYTMEGLVEDFSLENLSSAGAKFDYERLKWFNLKHLQLKPGEELFDLLVGSGRNVEGLSKEKSLKILNTAKERANTLEELWAVCHCFYEAPSNYEASARKKAITKNTKEVLAGLLRLFEGPELNDRREVKKLLDGFCSSASMDQENIRPREIMMPLRLSLVGSLSGLDVSFIISVIGLAETRKRLLSFIKAL